MTTTNPSASELTDEAIERAALKHVAPGFTQLAAVSKTDSDYRKSEQFKRLKAFALELHAAQAPHAGAALDALTTYPSPHGTLIRLADAKCAIGRAAMSAAKQGE